MATPEEIQRLKVSIEGDISALKDAVSDGVKETEKLGDASDKSSKKIEEGSKKSAGAVRKLGKGLSSVQETFSKLIIPVAFVTGVVALINKFRQLASGAADFNKELEKIGRSTSLQLQDRIQQENLNTISRQLLELERQRREVIDQIINKGLEQSEKTITQFIDGMKEILPGLEADFGLSSDDIFGDVDNAIAKLNRQFDELARRTREAFSVDRAKALLDIQTEAAEIEDRRSLSEADRLERQGKAQQALNIRLEVQSRQFQRQLSDLREERSKFVEEFGGEAAQVYNQLISAYTRANNEAIKVIAEQAEKALRPVNDLITRIEAFNSADFSSRLDNLASAYDRNTAAIRRIK